MLRLRRTEWRHLQWCMARLREQTPPWRGVAISHVKGLGALEYRLLKRGLLETMGPQLYGLHDVSVWTPRGITRVSERAVEALAAHPPHWGLPGGPANCHAAIAGGKGE